MVTQFAGEVHLFQSDRQPIVSLPLGDGWAFILWSLGSASIGRPQPQQS